MTLFPEKMFATMDVTFFKSVLVKLTFRMRYIEDLGYLDVFVNQNTILISTMSYMQNLVF